MLAFSLSVAASASESTERIGERMRRWHRAPQSSVERWADLVDLREQAEEMREQAIQPAHSSQMSPAYCAASFHQAAASPMPSS
jgi:hypothetical protein